MRTLMFVPFPSNRHAYAHTHTHTSHEAQPQLTKMRTAHSPCSLASHFHLNGMCDFECFALTPRTLCIRSMQTLAYATHTRPHADQAMVPGHFNAFELRWLRRTSGEFFSPSEHTVKPPFPRNAAPLDAQMRMTRNVCANAPTRCTLTNGPAHQSPKRKWQ